MPIAVAWLLTLLPAVVAGGAIAALLIAPPRLEAPAILFGAGMTAVSGWALLALGGAYSSFWRTFLAAMLGLGAAIGGYALVASLLPLLARRRLPSPLAPVSEVVSEPAYILLSRAEPERYEPRFAAAAIDQATDPETDGVPAVLLPFLFAAQKARYRLSNGRSPARETVRGIAQRLTRALRVPEVRVAFCEPPDSLAEAVRAAAAAGHTRVVVAPLAIAEGREEERAKEVLHELHPEEAGLEVLYTETLWSSEPLAALMAGRAVSFTDGQPSSGVALVLEGQPAFLENTFADFDQEEASFAGRVATLVTEAGIPGANVRTAWIDWQSPDVAETVRHLAALGCERIAVLPVAFPTESLATMLDLTRGAELARSDATVQVLPPWGNEQIVADEILRRMCAVLEQAPE